MQTFLSLPAVTPEKAASGQIVILGAPEATPYEPGKPSHSREAPAAIRGAVARYSGWHDHHDYDTGKNLYNPQAGEVVDAGDIAGSPDTPEENRARITQTITRVLNAGATPIVFGGDDSVPTPVFCAYENHGPIWIVQIDAHIDWHKERFGEPLGWSSTMRRASEMAWVEGIVQIGIRGIGSAYPDDVRDAEAWGAKIVTAREVHRSGASTALGHIPAGARVVISLDCDGIDPAFMPGVMAQAPGGLTYWHIIDLFDGLAEHQVIAGCNIVELAPSRDIGGISALTAGRIACNAIDAMHRSRANKQR